MVDLKVVGTDRQLVGECGISILTSGRVGFALYSAEAKKIGFGGNATSGARVISRLETDEVQGGQILVITRVATKGVLLRRPNGNKYRTYLSEVRGNNPLGFREIQMSYSWDGADEIRVSILPDLDLITRGAERRKPTHTSTDKIKIGWLEDSLTERWAEQCALEASLEVEQQRVNKRRDELKVKRKELGLVSKLIGFDIPK
jgi:hypothetical protein